MNIRLVLRRLKKISSIKLSAIAASLEKVVEIVVGLCVKIRLRHTSSVSQARHLLLKEKAKSHLCHITSETELSPTISHFCLISEKNQLTNRLLSAKIMGLKKTAAQLGCVFPIQFNTESCPSGRRCSTRNAVYVMYLGFESLTLRHKSTVILIELRWIFFYTRKPLEIGLFGCSGS